MRHMTANNTIDILQKINIIEKVIMDLKLSIIDKITPADKKNISLKGILKNEVITDEDISSAKKSLYSKMGV